MRLTELKRRKVAVAGYGREGAAACRTLLKQLPDQPLTVVCTEDVSLRDPRLKVVQESPDESEALLDADVIVASPGISPNAGALARAADRGIRITSGTAIFFAQRPDVTAACITGTKGKSTTVALTSHLLRFCGADVAVGGNIGVPMLDLLGVSADVFVVEISSYQARRLDIAPRVAACLNLSPEHLDWHGSEEMYFKDKLDLLRGNASYRLLNFADARLREFGQQHSPVVWFNHPDGVHVDAGQFYAGKQRIAPVSSLNLPGAHNVSNACAALAIVRCLGFDAPDFQPALQSFEALPHRLEVLGRIDGVTYVNDSISTTPAALMAALESFSRQSDLTVIIGGFDRGLDWTDCIQQLKAHPPARIIGLYAQGESLIADMRSLALASDLAVAGSVAEATGIAREMTPVGGLVLLSPGAPSFEEFDNFEQRAKAFAEAAGFA